MDNPMVRGPKEPERARATGTRRGAKARARRAKASPRASPSGRRKVARARTRTRTTTLPENVVSARSGDTREQIVGSSRLRGRRKRIRRSPKEITEQST